MADAMQWRDGLRAADAAGGSVFFYPYRTSYTHVAKKYAFDDDPLAVFSAQPYQWTIEVRRVSVTRSMATPRTSFVPEMYKSVEGI